MSGEMTIGDYWRVLRRRLSFIIIPTFAIGAGAYLYADRLPEIYTTAAQIEIQKNVLREGSGLQRGFVSPLEKQTLQTLATSDTVARLAAQALVSRPAYINENVGGMEDEIRGAVTVGNLDATNILEVRARGSNPVRIRDMAQAYAEALIVFYERDRTESVEMLMEYLENQIRSYQDLIVTKEDDLIAMKNTEFAVVASEIASPIAGRRIMEKVEGDIARLRETEDAQRAERDQIARGIADGNWSQLATIVPGQGLRDERRAITADQAALEGLLKKFTANHPQVWEAREALNARIEAFKPTVFSTARAYVLSLDDAIASLETQQMRLAEEREMIRMAVENLPEHTRNLKREEREIAVLNSVSEMLRQRLDDLRISANAPADKLFICQDAAVSRAPIEPDKGTIIGIGLAVGMLSGLAFAFISESIDTSLTALRDVERVVGKPILAVIPKIKIAPEKYRDRELPTSNREVYYNVPILVDPRSPAAEAYRTLRAVIKSRFFDAGFKSLLVTSTTPQEGKTTTMINLAIACANAGMKTVLVGANMRHPVIGKYFLIDRSIGLHEVLSGRSGVEEAIQATGVENLSILDSGSFARRPAELLSGPAFDRALAWMKERYDAVLVDSPPTLPVADAATLAPKVDGVLLVYLVSVAPRDALQRCKQTLEEVGGNIIGVVFNDIWGASASDYAGYYYHHRYADDDYVRL